MIIHADEKAANGFKATASAFLKDSKQNEKVAIGAAPLLEMFETYKLHSSKQPPLKKMKKAESTASEDDSDEVL